jgi:hypothetical protein
MLVATATSATTCKCPNFDWTWEPGECLEGEFECNDGICHDCCIDDDCQDKPGMADCDAEYIICNDYYKCECVCYLEGEDCSRDPEACCSGWACDIFTNTCMPECTSDEDCRGRDIPFSGDLECKNGVCVFYPPPCDDGHWPYQGDCVTKPGCDELKPDCIVLPASAVTQEGTSVRFAATPYLKSGAVAPGFSFTWSSGDDQIVSVDAGGRATGGVDTGHATITAVVAECPAVTCDAVVINYGAAVGTRIVVVNELTGMPVEGATVVAGAEAPVATDADGVAGLPVDISDANPVDITVTRRDYHYLSLLGVKRSDLIVYLHPLHHLDISFEPPGNMAGGIKGNFDFGMIRCEPPLKTCDVSYGMAGLSIPPGLTNLTPDMLYDGVIMRNVELGGESQPVPFKEGTVICLNQNCFKEMYSPTGTPGNRVAWGIGGKLDLADLIDKLGPIIGGTGDIDYGTIILGLAPLISNFYTAMVPNVSIETMPYAMAVADIDGDPETFECPDYDNFEEQDMILKVKMDQAMTFVAPALPVGTYDGVVIIGGMIVRGAGFVPLGLGAGVDSRDSDELPDGLVEDPIVVRIADVAGRVPENQVQRVVLAFAVKLEQIRSPEYWAGQILLVDSFSGTHTLPEFLPPVVARFDRAGRRLEILQMPVGVDLLQAVFVGERECGWNVLTDEFASFDLPSAPVEGDRADSVGVYAVELHSGGFRELVEFSDLNMGNIIENLRAFSFTEIP